MKVLLLGADGQLGAALRQCAPAEVDLTALSRSGLDICDAASVRKAMSGVGPEVVINAAAYTDVDRAESDPERAFLVNADAPGVIADSAATTGARMIHVSTDFVFGGDRPVPYDSGAVARPINVYGESKLAGERAVSGALGSDATIVRTSWLYGRSSRNFVTTILDLLANRERVDVVYDQVSAPTWTKSLATCIWAIARRPDIHGIQHWRDDGLASWYDFAVAIQEEATERGLLSKPVKIRPIRTEELPRPARRPRYSVLEKAGTARLLGREPCHWRDNLRTMFDELEKA